MRLEQTYSKLMYFKISIFLSLFNNYDKGMYFKKNSCIFKVRLVTKDFTQTYEVHYQKTFAPVAKMNTIKVLFSSAINLDWNLQ